MRSRYTAAVRRTRRQLLKQSVAGAMGVALVACGAKSSSGNQATTSSPLPGDVTDAAGAASSTSATTGGAVSADTSSTSPAASGPTWVDGQTMTVGFTYVAEGNGRIHNPYAAVWIEDANGLLVRTIGVSVQLGKGLKWLDDLKQWYRVDQARIDAGGADTIEAISGPTRQPGAFEYTFDGRTDTGALLGQGTYVLYIEAVREKGPYSVLRYDVVVDGQPLDVQLESSGEIQNVHITIA